MNKNYDELASKLAMGRDVIVEEMIPSLHEEARKRRDGEMIACRQ